MVKKKKFKKVVEWELKEVNHDKKIIVIVFLFMITVIFHITSSFFIEINSWYYWTMYFLVVVWYFVSLVNRIPKRKVHWEEV